MSRHLRHYRHRHHLRHRCRIHHYNCRNFLRHRYRPHHLYLDLRHQHRLRLALGNLRHHHHLDPNHYRNHLDLDRLENRYRPVHLVRLKAFLHHLPFLDLLLLLGLGQVRHLRYHRVQGHLTGRFHQQVCLRHRVVFLYPSSFPSFSL